MVYSLCYWSDIVSLHDGYVEAGMVLSSKAILAVFILFDNSKEWLNGIGGVSLYYIEINSKIVNVCQIHCR